MHHHDPHDPISREDAAVGLLLATQQRRRSGGGGGGDDGGFPLVSVIIGLIGLGVISGPFCIITVPAAIVILLIALAITG